MTILGYVVAWLFPRRHLSRARPSAPASPAAAARLLAADTAALRARDRRDWRGSGERARLRERRARGVRE